MTGVDLSKIDTSPGSPRPTYPGSWADASGRERAAWTRVIKRWTDNNPEAAGAAGTEVQASGGSGGSGRAIPAEQISTLPLDQIKHLAAHSRNDQTRLQAARYLDERQQQEADEEHLREFNEVTQALAVLPQKEKVMALEAMTRRNEETPWRSVFDKSYVWDGSGDWVFSPEEEA